MNVEILEFVRPDGPQHSLYITGISQLLSHNELYDVLHEKFSPFGALYEIQIMDGNHGNQVLSDKKQAVPANELKQTSGGPNQTSGDPNQTSGVPNQTSGGPNQTSGGPNQTSVDPNQSSGGLYAFVKFYSARSAARAKRGLTGRLFVSGQHMRIRYSTRQCPEEAVPLYYTKCYELANHYLSFNGWSIAIIMCRENKEHSAVHPEQVQYVSGIKLHIPHHGVSSEGYGVAITSHSNTDPCSKSVAICRAKKQSYQQAVQNAFQRVLLVILDNGKVYVDINSTVEDRVHCDEQLTVDNTLKVNDLDLDPDPIDADEFEDSADMDLLNKQLLEDLEAENL